MKSHGPIIENIEIFVYVSVVLVFFLKDLTGETDDIRCLCIFIDYEAKQDNYLNESSNVGKVAIYLIETSLVSGSSAGFWESDSQINIVIRES